MQDIFDFVSLVINECDSLIEICPPSIQAIVSIVFTFSAVLAVKRCIID